MKKLSFFYRPDSPKHLTNGKIELIDLFARPMKANILPLKPGAAFSLNSAQNNLIPSEQPTQTEVLASVSSVDTSSVNSLSPELKLVPQDREIRFLLWTLAGKQVATWPKNQLLSRSFLEEQAKQLLCANGMESSYTGWAMVAMAGEYWKQDIIRIPKSRRLLLLPQCLRNSTACRGTFDGDELICAHCGQCVLDELITEGRSQGYQILVAEGTPVVMRMILSGKADAITGVGCLHSLERVFEKLLVAGIPAIAVPLLEGTCKDTQTDLDKVRSMIALPWTPSSSDSGTPGWLPLLRLSSSLFEQDELERLLGNVLPLPSASSSALPSAPSSVSSQALSTDAKRAPFSDTQRCAIDFLMSGGKYYRPFMTLAAYDVATHGIRRLAEGEIDSNEIPIAVRRVAVAMEFFHKASLVHDDIEDDDPFRYGHPTLHRKTGIPAAVNVGDYLLGEGYRIIACCTELPATIQLDLLRRLSDCHVKLCRGQGTELYWTAHSQTDVPEAVDVLNMYSLKTAPAFRAAIYAGFRLALDDEKLAEIEPMIDQLSKYWGIAFQIRNDLLDWKLTPNKERCGDDFFGRRPTILRSFARSGLSRDEWNELESLARIPLEDNASRIQALPKIQSLYLKANAFTKAGQLIKKYRAKCLATISPLPRLPWVIFLEYLTGIITR